MKSLNFGMKNATKCGIEVNIVLEELNMNYELVMKTVNYWLGKKNNPLNGKTFKEIEQLAEKYGYDLGGMNATTKE